MSTKEYYENLCMRVERLPKGTLFRLKDVTGMPVAGAIGFLFREDVKKRRFKGVRFVGNLNEANVYEKR